MDESLRKAVIGAANIKAPASNLGASQAPELAALSQADFALPVSGGASSILSAQASDVVAEQKRAAAEAKRKQKELSDISSYKIVKKADGGYDYFDPDGNQVDIATLSERTGAKPSDLVRDSENPIDIQYQEDYANLQDYIKAKLSNDKAKIDGYEAADPSLSQYQGKGGAHQLIMDFQKAYQRYYVPRSQNPNAWGITPSDKPVVPAFQSGSSSNSGNTL